MNDLTLVIQRTLSADPQRVFEAWTRPELFVQWWGPEGVGCPEAHFDLKVGGAYRVANELPDGTILWLSGHFEKIEPYDALDYTWQMGDGPVERVAVAFKAVAAGTQVVIRHERIASEPVKVQHGVGWNGCLDGLDRLFG